MIRMIVKNTNTGSEDAYEIERFTTMRTRMVPYAGEAFDINPDTTIVGSTMGTLVCKHKEGKVFYRNEQLGIDAQMSAMACRREYR